MRLLRPSLLPFLLLVLLAAPNIVAESLGAVTSVKHIPGGVELTAGAARVRVTAITPSTFRVRAIPKGEFAADQSWAVVYAGAAPDARVTESAADVIVTTTAGSVRIERNSLRLAFLDPQGNVVNHDAEPMSFDGAAFRVAEAMADADMFFGLGDKTSLNLRDHNYTLWNSDVFGWQESTDPLYKSIPFFISMRNGKAYGIFMDNTWRSSFDFGKHRHNAYSFGAEGGELNYYFFLGPSPKQVLAGYTQLTGTTPLPPLWALGYQQCRYSYYPEARVREIARTFREKQIPADVIYLDIDYQEKYRPFTINREYFPTFEGMVKDLKAEGFGVIAITDLHIAKADYPPYNQGHARDLFVKNPDGSEYVGPVWPGDSVFPEFTLTRGREYWGMLYKDFVAKGIRGFWNDMNEPAVFRETKTMPLDVVHRLDDGRTLPHLAAHNIVGMQNSRATYEGLLKLQGNERPFVLTRATYAGGQRYAASWTGDNSSTWNHLRMSVPTLLNLGISGYPLVGDDIGGFNGSPTAELMTRWMFVGVFNPVYRDHTAKGTNDQEPWAFGPEHERYMKAAIEQRYRMLPYIYTAAEEASRTGTPMMRPLFLEFPQEQWLNGNQEEFMFGPAMLVAPKVWDMVDAYEVQLPSGTWYDYWTGDVHQGGPHDSGPSMTPEIERLKIRVKPAVNEIPVYVKAGSIIPQQPVVQSTAYTPQGPLELRVYPGPDCKGELYSDDGHTFDYKSGKFQRVAMSCTSANGSASLTLAPAQGAYTPWFTELQILFYGASGPAKSARMGGRDLKATYDAQHHVVSVAAPFTTSGGSIEVTY